VNGSASKFKDIITWPEFRVAWALLAALAAAFAIIVWFLNPLFVLIEAGLIALAAVFAFMSVYRAARTDRDADLERSELKSVLSSLNDALVVYDKGFRVIFFNAAAERIFKISAKAIIGHVLTPQDVEKEGWRTFVQIVFPSLAPRVTARSVEGQYPQIFDVSFTDPEAEFRVTTAPIEDEAGKTLAFIKIVRDRTAQIAALRSRSELVTVASHQLRGPVGDLNWALESLAKDPSVSTNARIMVEGALAVSRGLLRRIEDILNVTKMEEGQFGYHFEETDAVQFVEKILTEVLPEAQKAGVKLYLDRPKQGIPRVVIDPQRLSLAFMNILENAIRYNVQNGEVTVKVDNMEGKPFVIISVKDTGIGIPKESLDRLFTKFYRADNAVKVQTEGSGLGLYIARSIVNAHGGKITAASELNRGTVISIALPTDPSLIPREEVGAEDLI
jgi:two-component system, OmpR family, sensor histidine kinase VicK